MLVIDTKLGSWLGITNNPLLREADNVYDTETEGGMMDTLRALVDDFNLKSSRSTSAKVKYLSDKISYYLGQALAIMESEGN